MPEAQAVAMQPEAPRMGQIRRLIAIFWEPGAGLADVARRPVCWVPLLLVILSAFAYTYLISSRIGWEQVIREGVASSQRIQDMAAADRERLISQQAKITGVVAYVGAALGTPISVAVIAGCVMLFFTVFLGGTARYRQLFGVVAYAQLPAILSMAIASVVMHLKPPEDFDIRNPVALNIGFYLPESVPKWLVSVGSSIDLITFWIVALIVIGLRAVDPKASRGSAVASVLLPWAIYVLGKAVYTALVG